MDLEQAVGKFFSKGRSIFIEGRLKLDQWESKEGDKRSALKVVLDSFEFVDSKQESSTKQSFSESSSSSERDQPSPSTNSPSSNESELDDDVPFNIKNP